MAASAIFLDSERSPERHHSCKDSAPTRAQSAERLAERGHWDLHQRPGAARIPGGGDEKYRVKWSRTVACGRAREPRHARGPDEVSGRDPRRVRPAVRLRQLVQFAACTGKQVHDANIVATALGHGVERVLTENVEDFTRFSDYVEIVALGVA